MKFVCHLALVFGAFIVAYDLRLGLSPAWWLTNPHAGSVLLWSLQYTCIAAGVELLFRTERESWRFASVRDVLCLARSTAITAGAFLIVSFLGSRAIELPRSTIILAWLLSLFALVGVRLVYRLHYDQSLTTGLFRPRQSDGPPMILVGKLQEADAYLRHAPHGAERHYGTIGIVSPTAREVGQYIQGVPVVAEFSSLVEYLTGLSRRNRTKPAVLFLSDPIHEFGYRPNEIGRMRNDGYKLLRQQNLAELGVDGGGAARLREIKLEEFLPRAPLSLDGVPIGRLVAGRRVLVTGAGGSIGSEIARQLVSFGCSQISLLDHSEFLLFEIHRELEQLSRGKCACHAILCNVRDEVRVGEIFAAEKPELVFHAAALKHVTLVENNPCEGALTNVVGTWNVAAKARECGAQIMVMISTDKAVDPSNVMGSTKRIAESLLAAHAVGNTRYCAVRFGNVLGSAGSVVPIFRDQIERGGPITVTHEDVERYFMTIPEAVQLVLHATALREVDSPKGLRKFVLEMGEPVKIIELARRMIELTGDAYGRDLAIKIVGLRPGEKLTEELLDEHEIAQEYVPGISEIVSTIREGVISEQDVTQLSTLAKRGASHLVRELIADYVEAIRVVDGGETNIDPSVNHFTKAGEGGIAGARRSIATPATTSPHMNS